MAQYEVARLVAEQLAVVCGTADVDAVLGGSALASRGLLSVLRLAGDAGEAAGLLLLGDAIAPSADRALALTAAPIDGCDDLLRVEFEWRTSAYTVLFDVLRGRLVARAGPPGVVLGVQGTYGVGAGLAGRELGVAAARRAAEVAVRAWLGQLRSALEHGGEWDPGPPLGAAAPAASRDGGSGRW